MRGVKGDRPARLCRAALFAALPLLSGCIGEQREMELGDQIAAQINANVPLVKDIPLNLYVGDLGRLIARHSERPDLPYRFYIVDTDGVNAFALPGGHIYINRGLIERTRNVSELAGVLAHEIGHVAARHGAKALQRQLRTRSMSHFLYSTLLGREPLLNDEALDVGGELWMAAHSRSDEQEADRLAVKYLISSGVDPRGMLSLFDEFEREEAASPEGALASWFSTHPASHERLLATGKTIREQLNDEESQELAVQVPSYREFMHRLRALPPPDPGELYEGIPFPHDRSPLALP